MTAAEALHVLESIRAEEESRLYAWHRSLARTLQLPASERAVAERFDRRLTALAVAMDALLSGRRLKGRKHMMTLSETKTGDTKTQAARLLTQARTAACMLDRAGVPHPRVELGSHLPVELLRSVAKLAGAPLDVYRYMDLEGEMRVREDLRIQIGEVQISASSSRPSTDADVALPPRGGRA